MNFRSSRFEIINAIQKYKNKIKKESKHKLTNSDSIATSNYAIFQIFILINNT